MASNSDEIIDQSSDSCNEEIENESSFRPIVEEMSESCERQVIQATDGLGNEVIGERANCRTGLENVLQNLCASDSTSSTSGPTSNSDQTEVAQMSEVQLQNDNYSPDSNPSTSEENKSTTSPMAEHCVSRTVDETGDAAASSKGNDTKPMSEAMGNGIGRPSITSSSSEDSSSEDTSSSSGFDSVPEDFRTIFRSRKRPSNASSSDEAKVPDSYLSEKEKPKHNWFIVNEVVNRQRGVGARYAQVDGFRQRFYSSLHAVQRLELMYKLENHSGCVNTLNFNSRGTLLASGSDDLAIVLWNWATGRTLVKYKSGHRSNVFQAKFLPLSGDSHIVSCSRDGQVRLGEMSPAGKCLSTKKLATHCGAVHKLAIKNNTPHDFLSCGEDALVLGIDVRLDKPRRLHLVKEDQQKVALYGIHSNPNNSNLFCVNGRSNYIRVYDERMTINYLKKFCPLELTTKKVNTQVTSAMFNYNGTEILGSYNDDDIYLFDFPGGENYKHKYQGHRNNMTVKGVNFFGPKSEYVVSGSDCGNIFFWDKSTEAVVQWMPGDEGGVVNCLEPHPHIPVIATSGLDSDVKIWVPSNEQEPAMDGLRESMLTNYKSREQEREFLPDVGNPLMVLWRRHMRRVDNLRQNREQNESGGNEPGTAAQQDPSSDEDSDTEPQCATS